MTTPKNALDALLSTLTPLLEKAQLEKAGSTFSPISDEKGEGTLVFKDISQKEWLELQDHLSAYQQSERAHLMTESNQTHSLSRYFNEIKSCPMYKPKNPNLAISHVAKVHGIDVSELRKAFKEMS